MRPLLSPYNPVQLTIGIAIWSLWFIVLDGGQSVACAQFPPDPASGPWNWLNLVLGLFALVTAAFLAWLTYVSVRASKKDGLQEGERFVAFVAAGINAVSAISILVIAAPILNLPPCI